MADAAPKDASAPEKKSNLGKLVAPLFALVNLVVMGGGLFLVYKSTLGFESPVLREPAAFEALKKDRKEVELGGPVLYTMPSFTVNLSGAPRRLIRVEMSLEMLDKDGFEEIVRNSPAARDSIVRILNRKSFDDIETIQGKLFLKDQIAVSLNQSLKKGVVKDIYFSEFLVQ
jgi:flagellar FliL protein